MTLSSRRTVDKGTDREGLNEVINLCEWPQMLVQLGLKLVPMETLLPVLKRLLAVCHTHSETAFSAAFVLSAATALCKMLQMTCILLNQVPSFTEDS